jgi:hypothetical protein
MSQRSNLQDSDQISRRSNLQGSDQTSHKYNRYLLTYPDKGSKIHKSKSLEKGVKKCYREFRRLTDINEGLFAVTDLDNNIEYQLKIKKNKIYHVKNKQVGGVVPDLTSYKPSQPSQPNLPNVTHTQIPIYNKGVAPIKTLNSIIELGLSSPSSLNIDITTSQLHKPELSKPQLSKPELPKLELPKSELPKPQLPKPQLPIPTNIPNPQLAELSELNDIFGNPHGHGPTSTPTHTAANKPLVDTDQISKVVDKKMEEIKKQIDILTKQLGESKLTKQVDQYPNIHIGIQESKKPNLSSGSCGEYGNNNFYKQMLRPDVHSAPSTDIYNSALITLRNIEDIDRMQKNDYEDNSCIIL